MDEHVADVEAAFSHDSTVLSCLTSYRAQARAMGENATDIQLALNAIDTETAKMNTLKDENKQAFLDGAAKVAEEQGRKYGSYAHTYWFDDKVDKFRKEMEWARRLTYLAMEAVEYEFQQSASIPDATS